MRFSRRFSIGALSVSVLVLALYVALAKKPHRLISGESVTRPSPEQKVHRYVVDAKEGEYFHLELIQADADLEMLLHGPAGKLCISRDSDQWGVGVEVISYVAQESGRYRLEVKAFEGDEGGQYHLVLDGPRIPETSDWQRAKATEHFYRAPGLKGDSENPELQRKVERYLEAATNWVLAGDSLQAGVAYLQAANVNKREDWRACLEFSAKAEAIFEAIKRPQLQAICLRNMGYAAAGLNDAEASIAHYQAALALWKAPNLERAHMLHMLGVAYRFVGQFRKAHQVYTEAKDIQDERGTEKSRVTWNDGYGALLLIEGKAEAAIPFLEKALASMDLRKEVRHRGLLTRLAEAYTLSDQLEKAMTYMERGLALLPDSPNSNRPSMIFHKALILFEMGELEESRKLLLEAEAGFVEYESKDERFNALTKLALVESAMGLCSEGREHAYQALNILEQQRQQTRSSEVDKFSLSIRYGALEILTDLMLGPDGCPEDLTERFWERLERLRAASLVETLEKAKAEKTVALVDMENRINDAWLKDQNKPESSLEDSQELTELERSYTNMLTRQKVVTENQSPTQHLRFDEMKELIDEKQERLLYYVMGEKYAYVLTIQEGQVKSFNLGLRADLELDIQDYLRRVKKTKSHRNDKKMMEIAHKLKRILPEPLLNLSQDRRLVIVTDGRLHELPFVALPFGPENEYLGTQFEISYLPSLTTLAAIKAHDRKATEEMVVFADPEQADSENGPLSFAREEAAVIAEAFPQAKVYLGNEATLALATSGLLADFERVHFATHGFIFPENGDLSALLLAGVDEEGNAQNKYLRASEVANLELHATLVVLGACQSGLGEWVRGEGLVGLPQAFLLSGAASVLVSFWDIKDQPTQVLMEHFYDHLTTKNSRPAEALRYAQKKMAEDKTWSDPYYWAAFRLIGDSDPQ